jgi:hypothetical protein
MPKRTPPKPTTKKSAAKAPAPTAKPDRPEKPEKAATSRAPNDSPLALRVAVFEDVVRRAAQETRALQTELASVRAAHTELTRRVADVEKRVAAS